jgi:MEMO1 family protein
MVRQPAVAGQFYSEDGKKLRMELDKYVVFADRTEKALGIIAPHAGYIYSGSVAGQVYGQVTVPSCVIILGPNHHGLGAQAALYPEGEWLTPLGTARINTPLAELVRKHASIVQEDTTAHHYEHSP